MKFVTVALPLVALYVLPTIAQSVPQERIWSTVIYTRYGDRTPYILQAAKTLTPLGATQLYNAGNRFRDRYLTSISDNDNTVIQNISPFQLDNDQITTVSLRDQFVAASAQAFVQGLYPPLQASSNATFINGESQLANGSNVVSPLDGYQYAQIDTVSALDLNSIWLNGANNCPIYSASKREYFDSASYEGLLATNMDFYQSLQPALLDGVFANTSVNYLNAYLIFDYLNYGSIHNNSFSDDLSFEDLTKAKLLADNWIWATYGNTSASGLTDGDQIRAIAGRTLANRIVQALYSNINTSGAYDKMTLLFGGLEPIVSFAALSGLASEQNPEFYGIPEYGSSMVFELFSVNGNDTDVYPSPAELNVRFFFQNGTDETSALVAYPLFGNGPEGMSMPLSNFVSAMQEFMILSPAGWCRTCASYSIFCPAFQGDDDDDGVRSGGMETRRGLKPAIAGVIGAVVTLAVLGLVLAAVMLFGGVRLYRRRTSKRSELNGFKGGEKLASDQDLSIPKGGAGASVAQPGTAPVRGHERVGSWELGDQRKAEEAQLPGFQSHPAPVRRPSFEQDDLHVNSFGEAVKPHDRV